MKNFFIGLLVVITVCGAVFFNKEILKNATLSSTLQARPSVTDEISIEVAYELIESRFKNYDVASITYKETLKEPEKIYVFDMEMKNGQDLRVELHTKGGYILNIVYEDMKIANFDPNKDCMDQTQDFIRSIGFEDMVAIWSTKFKDHTIVNLTPIMHETIIYPDLIKATVDCKTGDIAGLESRTYLQKEVIREEGLFRAKIPYEEASKKIDDEFKIIEYRTVIIIDKELEERLAYEIKAEYKGFTYYFYIDCTTGDRMQVLTPAEL